MSLNDEDFTFRRLKRIPLEKMMELIDNIEIDSVLDAFPERKYYMSSEYHEYLIMKAKNKLLDDNGWEYEEYVMEIEKQRLEEYIQGMQSVSTMFTDFVQTISPSAEIILPTIKI